MVLTGYRKLYVARLLVNLVFIYQKSNGQVDVHQTLFHMLLSENFVRFDVLTHSTMLYLCIFGNRSTWGTRQIYYKS